MIQPEWAGMRKASGSDNDKPSRLAAAMLFKGPRLRCYKA